MLSDMLSNNEFPKTNQLTHMVYYEKALGTFYAARTYSHRHFLSTTPRVFLLMFQCSFVRYNKCGVLGRVSTGVRLVSRRG